jgi:Ca2+-binding EF-hand superfamily protein
MRPGPILTALVLLAGIVPAAPASEPARDLAFLTEDRPVFLRLRVTTGGKPFEAAWPESVKTLHASLDRDGDGKLAAKEADAAALAALVRLAAGGAQANATGGPGAPWKDGAAPDDLAEALRPVLGPFRVQVGRVSDGRTDALFDHLDRDKDGKLTRSELAAITGSLRRLDLDDNEMISADELEPFNNPAVAARAELMSGRRSRFAAIPPVVELTAGESSLRLARLLMRKYDRGRGDEPGRPDGKLSPLEFAIDPDAFSGADANHDGAIGTEELRRYLAGGPVDLTLEVDFPPDGPGRPTVRIVGDSDGAKARGVKVRQLADGDVEYAVGRVRLDVHVDGGESAARSARRTLARRFEAADANNDGYLDGKEPARLNAPGSPLAGLTGVIDRDGDGKLYAKELADFVEHQLTAARGRLVLTTSDQGRAIFGVLDLDRDRRLGAREVMRTLERVTTWDGDGDGRVAAEEVPYHVQVTLVRGELSGLVGVNAGAGAGAATAAALQPTASAGPDWFRKMDRNHDGDVSRREFLGPREQFSRLDRDRDGLIDPTEAAGEPR